MSDELRAKLEASRDELAGAAIKDMHTALDQAGILLSARVQSVIDAQIRGVVGATMNSITGAVELASASAYELGTLHPNVELMHLLILAGMTGSKAEAVRVLDEKMRGEVSKETLTRLVDSVGILSQFAKE